MCSVLATLGFHGRNGLSLDIFFQSGFKTVVRMEAALVDNLRRDPDGGILLSLSFDTINHGILALPQFDWCPPLLDSVWELLAHDWQMPLQLP